MRCAAGGSFDVRRGLCIPAELARLTRASSHDEAQCLVCAVGAESERVLVLTNSYYIKSTKKKKNLKNCGIPIINGGWTD